MNKPYFETTDFNFQWDDRYGSTQDIAAAQANAKIAPLIAKLERYEKALKYISSGQNHRDTYTSDLWQDCRETARKALEGVE